MRSANMYITKCPALVNDSLCFVRPIFKNGRKLNREKKKNKKIPKRILFHLNRTPRLVGFRWHAKNSRKTLRKPQYRDRSTNARVVQAGSETAVPGEPRQRR